jgi:hypothetical protein
MMYWYWYFLLRIWVLSTAAYYILINILKTLAVRLVGGSHNEGRVEVYHSGTWGTVCDDSWGINDARVVCRQLGFQDALTAPCCANFGRGTGQIWLDNVDCTGYESSLLSCRHSGVGIHNCGHHEDAGVRCNGLRGENWAMYYRCE